MENLLLQKKPLEIPWHFYKKFSHLGAERSGLNSTGVSPIDATKHMKPVAKQVINTDPNNQDPQTLAKIELTSKAAET